MIWSMIFLCLSIFIYHHVVYPRLLKFLVRNKKNSTAITTSLTHRESPSIGVFIAAFNEAEFIEEKLQNLACQVYPNDKMGFHIVGDGCTDQTPVLARKVLGQLHNQFIYCTYDEFEVNSGKIAALNYLISKYRDEYDIIVFTDVSALLSVDCFMQIANSMQDSSVVALSGRYLPNSSQHDSLDKYWDYQNAIREFEGQLGAVNGYAGAMFAMRSEAVSLLDKQTINDDFVQLVSAVNKTHLACFNNQISIVECEPDDAKQDFSRRMRIGAGNWQQIGNIVAGMKAFNLAQMFSFFSNKLLRGIMPVVVMTGYAMLFWLAFNGDVAAQALAAVLVFLHFIGLIKLVCNCHIKLFFIDSINYVIMSYLAALIGVFSIAKFKGSWRRVSRSSKSALLIKACKRAMDIVGATIGAVLAIPIVLIAAIAIKLDSKGSVFYKQLRVGKLTPEKSELIYVYKLRTMSQDAEKASGAVWAQGNDPRVTRVGRFLRKTRIDELPQFWNVLIGEMALIGPRPERPTFYTKLEREVPYFIQRTYDIKPGISGLAQVMNGYDESIEDVRNKIAWDYSYALSMSRFPTWLAMECSIFCKTVKIVVLGKGQ